MGAEIDTRKVDIVKTDSNRVLTYAAVADMMNAHHTYVRLTGNVVKNSSVCLAISKRYFHNR